jgi:hypothetical protein
MKQLQHRNSFLLYFAPVRTTEWVVYAKKPFAGPQQVLDYLGRYTHRIAISNNRILDIENGYVRFRWKDYRNKKHQKIMNLTAGEFIRRFLMHVLPDRFQRIRYYGFLCNRYREMKLNLCRQLLTIDVVDSEATTQTNQSIDYRDRYEKLTGISLRKCPVCHNGFMREIEQLPANSAYRDTS